MNNMWRDSEYIWISNIFIRLYVKKKLIKNARALSDVKDFSDISVDIMFVFCTEKFRLYIVADNLHI